MPAASKKNSAPSHAAHSPKNEGALYAPPLFTMAAGKKACEALADEIKSIQPEERVTTRIDVEAATYAALAVVGFVSAPDVRARFARLPKEEFRVSDVDELETTCFAMLYSMIEARAAGALGDEPRLPAALVAEATEVEARMQALCEYHFADDPEIAPELARLRPGTGHRDLGNDLLGYARIYALRPEVVKGDPKHYRADDAARAAALSGSIIQKLSAEMAPKARAAYERYAQTWALLNKRYHEVRAAGLWLYRGDEGVEARFPSLFTSARASSGASRRGASKGAAEPNGEASGAGMSDAAAPA